MVTCRSEYSNTRLLVLFLTPLHDSTYVVVYGVINIYVVFPYLFLSLSRKITEIIDCQISSSNLCFVKTVLGIFPNRLAKVGEGNCAGHWTITTQYERDNKKIKAPRGFRTYFGARKS